MARERRTFKMDHKLLVDVIKRQAGSLWKATIEGIMNAIDAGASECAITMTRDQLRIHDNGKGFRSRADIENFFEVFGKPHDENEQKTFGTFRMGRGQLFAFGGNTWRSGTFEMTVDIERHGLDYHLADGLEQHDGCDITVELYKRLSHTDLARMQDEIKSNARYVEINATLDGKAFAVDRSRITWDEELPEADIRYRSNQDLRVYNQGILVTRFYRYKYGIGGDVVTKKALRINFARNDIMDDCPVWAKIVPVLQRKANASQTGTRTRTTATRRTNRRAPRRLTEEDRRRMINNAKDGQLEPRPFKSAKLFQRWNSSVNMTVRQIHNIADGVVTMAPEGRFYWSSHRTAEQLTINRLACVLNREMLQRWNYAKPESIVNLTNRTLGIGDRHALTYASWDQLVKALQSECHIVTDDSLNRIESIVLGVLRVCYDDLFRRDARLGKMRIMLGHGPQIAWTDAANFIVINRDHVRRFGLTPKSFGHYAHLILHETCHTVPTHGRHAHPKDFYKLYHDRCSDQYRSPIAHFIYTSATRAPAIARRLGHSLTEAELRNCDQMEPTVQSTT